MMDASIGGQIRRRRRALRLTQARLAELADLDQPAVSRLESGARIPPLPVLERVGAALGLRLVLRFEPVEAPRGTRTA
ncbi:helix-turn-helix domain-containing protein [Spirillospora sp. NPDC050679]